MRPEFPPDFGSISSAIEGIEVYGNPLFCRMHHLGMECGNETLMGFISLSDKGAYEMTPICSMCLDYIHEKRHAESTRTT